MPKTINPAIPAGAEGRVAIGHSDEQVAKLRAVTAEARHRQASGLAPQATPVTGQSADPAEPQLPMLNVARQVAGRRIAELRQQAEGVERELERGCIGAGGSVIEHLVTRQREARAFLADIRGEIARLETLAADDKLVREWAYGQNVR